MLDGKTIFFADVQLVIGGLQINKNVVQVDLVPHIYIERKTYVLYHKEKLNAKWNYMLVIQ